MNFSIEKALYNGFDSAKENYVLIWVNGFLAAITSILSALTVVGILVVPAIWAGYYESLLRIKRGEEVKIGSFFKAGFKHWGGFLILSFLAILGILLGSLLLLVPGIYLMVSWYFIFYVKIDNPELTISEVFGKSRNIVSSMGWFKLFLFILIIGLPLALADMLTLNLASLAFFPFVAMMQIEAYSLAIEGTENNKDLLISESDVGDGKAIKYVRSEHN